MTATKLSRTFFLTAGLGLSAASGGAAQNVPVTVPDTVGAFVLSDTKVIETGGIQLRYLDAAGQPADLYIYPVDETLLENAASDSAKLDAEAAMFVESLRYGSAHGWWDTYSMVVPPEPVRAQTELGELVGRKSVFVFRKRGQVFVSVMHVFLVNENFVKGRVSMHAEGWAETEAAQFGLHAVEALGVSR